MTTLNLTATLHPMLLPDAPAPVALQGRCSDRVCYAQKSTPTGARAYGHFSIATDALAEAVSRQLPLDQGDENTSAGLVLHRWLRDHDASTDDEPASTLPAAWPGAEHLVEELFSEAQARVFCACCNRNLVRRDVRLERTPRAGGMVAYRYLCPESHLLLSVAAAPSLAAAERTAA